MTLGLCLEALASVRAGAQEVDAVRLAEKMTTARHVLPVLRDPTGGQAQAAPDTEFLLIASTDGGVTGRARVGIFATGKFLADAIISGPISQGTAQLIDLSGLQSGVSAQFRGQWVLNTTTTIRPKAQRRSITSGENVQNLRDAVREVLSLNQISATPARSAASAGSTAGERIARRRVEDFASAWRKALDAGDVRRTSAVLLSGAWTVNNQSFPFADSQTLQHSSETHVGQTGTVALGFLGSTDANDSVQPRFYFGGGVTAGRTFQGQTPSQICQPLGIANATTCSSIAIGGPTQKDTAVVQGEGRVWILDSKLAFSVKASRDTKREITSVEFPTYFLHTVKDVAAPPSSAFGAALSGGVTYGWKTKPGSSSKEFFALLFVGTALGLPGLR
jgi:hypothetical protein